MNALFADLKLALRRLRQRPGFTLAAALALGLGIGSTTSVYSVLQAVVLRPLPYRDPGQLLLVWETQPAMPNASISAPDFRDWREQAKTVEMSAFTGDGFNLTGRDKPERLTAAITDASFFHVLAPRMVLGRAYQPGATREVVLGEGIFHRVFGGDPKIVGTTITLNGTATSSTECWRRTTHTRPGRRSGQRPIRDAISRSSPGSIPTSSTGAARISCASSRA